MDNLVAVEGELKAFCRAIKRFNKMPEVRNGRA